MTDNSAALRRARQQDSTTKRHGAVQTLQAMIDAGEPISFPAVARRANVSVSLLYSDPALAGRISDARDRQRQAGADRAWRLPARSLVTKQSLRADLANAREQARQLGQEASILRERLSRQLGAQADAARGRLVSPLVDQLEDRAGQLEADNHRLREQVSRLEAELRELTETLEAARAMNRELMNEINRPARPPAAHARTRSPQKKT